ncbi:hypothetical protein PIROE2DRAFT_58891 [Piromyces sp. E2]|nr:hypothetical protein PIROE2DRAFT_58891 [Piromyces sp. E2]|eukprot:OUM67285.1 hypothetical protein PIROE2DRAFT_58891 [Piromyces sp. E2]
MSSNENVKKRKLDNVSSTLSQKSRKKKTNNKVDEKKQFEYYIKTLNKPFKLIATDKCIEPVKDYVPYNKSINFIIHSDNFSFSSDKNDYQFYYCIKSDNRIKKREVNSSIRKDFKQLHFVELEEICINSENSESSNNKKKDKKSINTVDLKFKFLDKISPSNVQNDPCIENKDFLDYYRECQSNNKELNKCYFYIFVEFSDTEHKNKNCSAIVELFLYCGSDEHQKLYSNKCPEFIRYKNVHDYYNGYNKNELYSNPSPVISDPLLYNNTFEDNTFVEDNIFPLGNFQNSLPTIPTTSQNLTSSNSVYPSPKLSQVSNINMYSIPRSMPNSPEINSNNLMMDVNIMNSVNPNDIPTYTTEANNINTNSEYYTKFLNFNFNSNNESPANDDDFTKYININLCNESPANDENVYSPPYIKSPQSISDCSDKTLQDDTISIDIPSIQINGTIVQSSRNINEEKSLKEIILDEQKSKNLSLEINSIENIDKHMGNFNSNAFLISYYKITCYRFNK